MGNAWSTAISSDIQVLTACGNIGDRRVSNTRANLLAAVLSSVIRRVAVYVGIIQNMQGREVLPCPSNDRVSARLHKVLRVVVTYNLVWFSGQ